MSRRFLEPAVVNLCKDCPPEHEPYLVDPMLIETIGQAQWHAAAKIEKFKGDWTAEEIAAGKATPYEVLNLAGNMLVNNGINILLDGLIGTAITVFSNANARIGVGDSTTAAAASQTDLQASTNKLRKAMDATFPSRSGQVLTFKSTFGSSDANFAWQEWAIFNAASGSTSMLNRKVESMGTKSSGETWVHTATFTLT